MDPTTDVNQVLATPANDNKSGNAGTSTAKIDGNDTTPTNDFYKTFKTQEEFDKHSAGIKRTAQEKAEKEILALLGLKADEKEKLADFKKIYESSLSDAELQKKTVETLTNEVSSLKDAIEEKDAIIATLSKFTGKSVEDVSKITKMAHSLVSEDVTMDDALNEVFKMVKMDNNNIPKGTPPSTSNKTPITEINPFAKETFNMTEQGKLMMNEPDKARRLYFAVYNHEPNW